MATKNALTTQERNALLDDLKRMHSDADQSEGYQLLERFLPVSSHERALSRDVMVVRGDRGAGKSMLFTVLNALREHGRPIRDLFPQAEEELTGAVIGFTEKGTGHPGTDVVAQFVQDESSEQVRVMWMAHLVGCLSHDGQFSEIPLPVSFVNARRNLHDIKGWVTVADQTLSMLLTWLDGVHERLDREGKDVVLLYDHLDKIGVTSLTARAQATGSLLALWLSLSNRYRRLRAKIFVREDLFEASLSGSADASKLRSRSVALTWDVGSLYRMLIRQMAAQSAAMRAWIEDTVNKVPLIARAPFGWFPPDPLREQGRPSQAAFVEHLAGKQMGKGVKKGYVYRWIPARLQDARGAIVPRSLVNLISYAAEEARHGTKAGYKRLLHPRELQAAVQQTSKRRVDELAEEHAVVHRLEALKGITVPIERAELVRRLSQPSRKWDSFENDGDAVAAELERIGVLRERDRGRWDVPDIYRYGYGIRRKGGTTHPT